MQQLLSTVCKTLGRGVSSAHMKSAAITAPLVKYSNQWVALNTAQNKVLANGKTLKAVSKKIGDQKVVYMKVFTAAYTVSPARYGV